MENTIIYGKNAVIEALEAGEREFNKILISNSARSDVKIERIKELAQKNGIVFQFVAPQKLNQLEPEGRHQGVIAQISPVKYTDLDDFIEKVGGNVVILDGVEDSHNVGAIIRSCDQFGASLVVMPARHSANDFSDNEIIARSSAGASAYVPVSVVTNLVRAVQQLKDAGFWVYGADAGGENVTKLNFPAKTCIVMGSEGKGIARLLEEQCDSIVSIPTCGKIDSLNVSVAAGVLLYEVYRQKI